MKTKIRIAAWLLMAFALWTLLICFVDVQPIGPEGSSVGFATVNRWVHTLTGVHMGLYTLTDWLGLVPIAVGIGFGLMGLFQWLKRKSLKKVDFSILMLGGFYVAVIVSFLFFETIVVNFRPVLIAGVLEASYPSSTTMLVMCVMPTAIMQFGNRIKNKVLRNIIAVVIITFIAFMVIGRLICGVHWFTDIVGGALLSAGLVMMYHSLSNLKTK